MTMTSVKPRTLEEMETSLPPPADDEDDHLPPPADDEDDHLRPPADDHGVLGETLPPHPNDE